MTPLTPLLADARTRSELQALGIDVSPDSTLEELLAQPQARITRVAIAAKRRVRASNGRSS